MKWKALLCAAALGVAAMSSAMAANWNTMNESPLWAVTNMHQGNFVASYVPTVSIDLYEPPNYILSVNEIAMEDAGAKGTAIGRATYLLNFENKYVYRLKFDTNQKPYWELLLMATDHEAEFFNKLFKQAYGIDFIPMEEVDRYIMGVGAFIKPEAAPKE